MCSCSFRLSDPVHFFARGFPYKYVVYVLNCCSEFNLVEFFKQLKLLGMRVEESG